MDDATRARMLEIFERRDSESKVEHALHYKEDVEFLLSQICSLRLELELNMKSSPEFQNAQCAIEEILEILGRRGFGSVASVI